MESCQISPHLRQRREQGQSRRGGNSPKDGRMRKEHRDLKRVSLMMEVQGKISDVGMMSAEMKR